MRSYNHFKNLAINKFFYRLITVIIIATSTTSCDDKAPTTAQTANTTEQKTQPNIVYGDLVIKEQSDYLIIPVSILPDSNQERDSIFSKDSYDRKGINYYNIIFSSKKDAKSHLLLNKKAIITSFDLLEYRKDKEQPPIRYWIYRIIEKDTNGDKKINYEDATVGYLSDMSGKNLQRITPENSQLINWSVVHSMGALFLKITNDSDNDKKFTERDKTHYIRVNLDKPSQGTEIIPDALEKQIKDLVLK